MFEDLDSKKEKAYLLIDGDIVAYKCAATADGRVYSHPALMDTYKYKKDIVNFCVAASLDPNLVEVKFIPDPVEFAIHSVKLSMDRILEDNCKYECITCVFLTGKDNYRNAIHPDYKKNREGMRRPTHLAACKEYLSKKYRALTVEPYEADDLIGIAATSHKADKENFIVCTIDKDLKMIPGTHYHLDRRDFTIVCEEEALETFYKQVLTGDKTDGIVGLDGVGPATAEKQIQSELYESCYEAALALYFKHNPRQEGEDWFDWVNRVRCLFYNVAQLIWIRRRANEFWKEPEGFWE